MNTNLTLGTFAFLLWSVLSTWYYTCQIKGLCLGEESMPFQTVEIAVSEEKEIEKIEEGASVEPVIEVEELSPIEIVEREIFFSKNSTTFKDPSYVQHFTDQLKSQIEGREVAIKIVGSTCDLGSANYNNDLGMSRAQTMRDYFILNEFQSADILVESEGEISSRADLENERQKNRKVTITIKSTDQ